MSSSRPDQSSNPMSPPKARPGQSVKMPPDAQMQHDDESKVQFQQPQAQVQTQPQPQPQAQAQPGMPESPYPYYTPREGEVIWPPGPFDASQQPYMGAGPSRIPYDPGAFPFGTQGQTSQYPTLDRAFDSGNYHGMTSPPSTNTNPSTNLMTPNYPLSNSNTSQQPLRSNDGFAGMSNVGSSSQNQQYQSNQHPQYPYNPPDTQPTQGESWHGRRHSSGLNKTSGQWDVPDYGSVRGHPGLDFRPFIPPNFDPNLYNIPPPSSSGLVPDRPQVASRFSDPSTSLSDQSVTSPPEEGNGERARRKTSHDIEGDDEEEWKHLSEADRAIAKANKRRGQNKIAQRAFRARTRMNKAQTTTDLAHLTELNQAQAKRLDEMTTLVATLQKENLELRMAAMSGQPPPPRPPSEPSAPTRQADPPGDTVARDFQHESADEHVSTPARKKRNSRQTKPEPGSGPPKTK